jgi:predicted DsbA family dithiol-disulfide isomerase
VSTSELSQPSKAARTAPSLAIDVYYDFVCPWCLIGIRNLRTALRELARALPDVQVNVRWRGHQLLPGTPRDGVPYQAFYVARLGSAQAVAARRAQVRRAGQAAGITFAFERIEVMPNTAAALRLAAAIDAQGNPAQTEALIDRLFTAYFIEGENIGDARVLERIGGALPKQSAGARPDQRNDHAVTGVPFFVFNGSRELAGAQSSEVLLNAMLEALYDE